MAGFGFGNVGFVGSLYYVAGGTTPPPAGARVYCLDDYVTSDYVQ